MDCFYAAIEVRDHPELRDADSPTQRVGAPEDGRRVGGADAADETDELFSNIGR